MHDMMHEATVRQFHGVLREKMDEYAHLVYRITKTFPREELYGATSQLRRASVSVMLNYIEGFARKKKLVKINFFETPLGSLQESKYLLDFSYKENWAKEDDYTSATALAEEIGAML